MAKSLLFYLFIFLSDDLFFITNETINCPLLIDQFALIINNVEIYKAFCLDITESRRNWAPNGNRSLS